MDCLTLTATEPIYTTVYAVVTSSLQRFVTATATDAPEIIAVYSSRSDAEQACREAQRNRIQARVVKTSLFRRHK